MSNTQNASIEPTLSAQKMDVTMNKTVLIVEDDDEIGKMLVLLLSLETPYQVRLVHSGKEALWAVKEISPVLFLFDYYLPQMTGIQLYDQLHARKEWETVPAIMMSANLPVTELQKRHIPGIAKPFDLDELLQVIEKAVA